MPPRDRSIDAFMAELAQDEPASSPIRRFAEERRLVAPRDIQVPSWCVLNAWVQQPPFGRPMRVVHLGPALVHLQSPDEPGTSYVRYEHLPLWEATAPPQRARRAGQIRGRTADLVMIDEAASFALDLETSMPNRYTTADIDDARAYFDPEVFRRMFTGSFAEEEPSSEEVLHRTRRNRPAAPPSYEQLEGRSEGRRVAPAPRPGPPPPAPSRFDRDDVV